jgi:hypothetical protein
VLAYAAIQHQLDIPADIRQLEDFIITECFYTGERGWCVGTAGGAGVRREGCDLGLDCQY